MTVTRMNFNHITYLGAFALATDNLLLVPSIFEKIPKETSELEVPVIKTLVGQSSLIGILAAGNSHGIAVPDMIDVKEERLDEQIDSKVTVIPGKYTALGNQILANDKGAIVNPDLPKNTVDLIEKALGVQTRRSTIAGLRNTGAAGVATNKGVLLHPETTEEELEIVEKTLQVQGDIGTALSGVKYIGTCIIANSSGALTGKNTTGPELGRIENALGFI